jgi:AcrR family transcriptional regulator
MSLRMVADHGLTTSAMQQVADEMGVSRPYVFRLSGSKQSFVLACMDEPEGRAREVLRQAAATCPSDLLQAMGRPEDAMGHLKQAVTIFTEVGAPDRLQPEIWKLVEW